MKKSGPPHQDSQLAGPALSTGGSSLRNTAGDHISTEELIAEISARLMKASAEELDAEISWSLHKILVACQVDRCGLIKVQPDSLEFVIAHAWQNPNVPQFPMGADLASFYPWSVRRLLVDRETVVIESVDDLPPEASIDQQSHRQRKTKSSLNIPLIIGNQVHHIFGMGAVIKHRTWDIDFIRSMRLLGEIFVSTLQRRDSELQLREQMREIERLRKQLELENTYLRQEIEGEADRRNLQGLSSMRKVRDQIEQVAGTGATVLIQGETGTGKELIAKAIHHLSDRRQRIMIKVNCAALPAALVESELFGREKGAFTGALSRQIGRFELADGATLFLDEIGELPQETQSKLLRVLQDGEFERLGSPRTIKVDVRVIAATNRNLLKEIEQGRFRRDLYYRLNVFPITVPPLRERTEDIPQLVWEFVNEFGERMGKKVRRISNDDMRSLTAYAWPGNVRELRNVIERAMIMSKGERLELADPVSSQGKSLCEGTLEEVERQHILATLEATRGRIKGAGGAATRLGINPSTLYSRMRKLGIHPFRN